MRKMKRFAKRCSSFIIAVVMAVSGVVPYTSITEVKAAASDTYDIKREISRRNAALAAIAEKRKG